MHCTILNWVSGWAKLCWRPDDLVLIAGSPKHAMDKLLRLWHGFAKTCTWSRWYRKLLSWPTPLTPSIGQWNNWGGDVSKVPRSKHADLWHEHGGYVVMLKRATGCSMSIMNLTHAGLDKALIAKRLWECCAIPSILYCAEGNKRGAGARTEYGWSLHSPGSQLDVKSTGMDGWGTSPYAGQNTSQTGKLYLDSCQIQNQPNRTQDPAIPTY